MFFKKSRLTIVFNGHHALRASYTKTICGLVSQCLWDFIHLSTLEIKKGSKNLSLSSMIAVTNTSQKQSHRPGRNNEGNVRTHWCVSFCTRNSRCTYILDDSVQFVLQYKIVIYVQATVVCQWGKMAERNDIEKRIIERNGEIKMV